MRLPNEISVEMTPGNSRSFSELPVIIIDNEFRKTVDIQLPPFMRPLNIWKDSDYMAAGDYTQSQVESRILELMSGNPSSFLKNLYISN